MEKMKIDLYTNETTDEDQFWYWDASSEDTIKNNNKFEKWYDAQVKECKSNDDLTANTICNYWYTTEAYAWTATEDAFIISAVQGIGIAMPLAFIVLLIFSSNWIMAAFATLDIIGVMACELAVMSFLGFKFGVSCFVVLYSPN